MATKLLSEIYELPSGITAEIREFTGREEDLLTDERVVKSNKVVQRILGNVILNLDGSKPTGADITNMWSADRFAALVHARVLTYGPEFKTEHECVNTDCRVKSNISVNLPDGLKYKERGDSFETQVELPGGATATMRPLRGGDEDNLLQARGRGELMTELLFSRTISISDIDSRQELRTYLRDGPSRIRMALREALAKTDFGYSQQVEYTCNVCGTEQEVDVITSRDFFFPGETT